MVLEGELERPSSVQSESLGRDRQLSTPSERLPSRLSNYSEKNEGQAVLAHRPAPAGSTVTQAEQLRQALNCLTLAEQALYPLSDEASSSCVDRLQAVQRLLEDGLAVANASTVDSRLQVLLHQHGKALADYNEIQEKREAETPEIMELKRSVADMERRVAIYRATPTPTATPRVGPTPTST
eukprot:gb/GFBE01040172.1/.p1 GENE.gb/GFBE01040172.1/~~gb/GFBE01040172.1/.p1  ORF type:complete len:182 (+),score=24.44 gb/GFBE01040172.1/:1-546(+)